LIFRRVVPAVLALCAPPASSPAVSFAQAPRVTAVVNVAVVLLDRDSTRLELKARVERGELLGPR